MARKPKKPKRLFRRPNPLPRGFGMDLIPVQVVKDDGNPSLEPPDARFIADPSTPGLYWVDPNQMGRNKEQAKLREALPPDLMARAEAIYPMLPLFPNLNQFTEGFLYDRNPGREIAIWECIAWTYQQYIRERGVPGAEQMGVVFKVLLDIAGASVSPAQQALPEGDADFLLQTYISCRMSQLEKGGE